MNFAPSTKNTLCHAVFKHQLSVVDDYFNQFDNWYLGKPLLVNVCPCEMLPMQDRLLHENYDCHSFNLEITPELKSQKHIRQAQL